MNYKERENATWNSISKMEFANITSEANVTEHRVMTDGATDAALSSMAVVVDVMDVILTPTFSFIGVFGNIMNLGVLLKSHTQLRNADVERNSGTNLGLVLLSVSDLLFCLSVCPRLFINLSAHMALFPKFGFQLLYQTYGTALVTTFLLTSTWITVVMAMLRYLAICHPLYTRRVDAKCLSKIVYIVSCIFGVSLNLPAFWEYSIHTIELPVYNSSETETHYLVDLGYFSSNNMNGNVFIWCRAILGIFIPATILSFCYVSLVVALQRSIKMQKECYVTRDSRGRHSNRITRMLITLVILFILLVFPCEIMDFCHDVVHTNTTRTQVFMVARSIANVLQVVNFSCNFILYCAMSVHFRRTFTRSIYFFINFLNSFHHVYRENMPSPFRSSNINNSSMSTRV